MARDYRSNMVRVRLLAALFFVIPLSASATIYQWTDEQGHVVFGNQVPESGVKNVRAVMKEDAVPANTNRELEERIARLERQLQAAQSAPAPYPVAQAPYPATPPMSASYYGAPYYPAMYPPPPYYPFGYAYGLTVVRPARAFAVSQGFAARPFISFHRAGVHRR